MNHDYYKVTDISSFQWTQLATLHRFTGNTTSFRNVEFSQVFYNFKLMEETVCPRI